MEQKVLVVLDCEYGNSSWVNQTADIEGSKLMRIRSNGCLYGEPEAYGGKGRPKKHGKQFKINDQATWWQADEIVEINDPKLGLIGSSRLCVIIFAYRIVKYLPGKTFRTILLKKLSV